MSVHMKSTRDGHLVVIHASGRLTRGDYLRHMPEVDRLIKRQADGRVSMLVEMRDFHGWKLGGFWEDLRFALAHYSQLDRIAMVGETHWQQAMSKFCRPFTKATIRFFDSARVKDARSWVQN